MEGVVVEGGALILEASITAGRAFDDMDEGELACRQLFGHGVEERLRIGVGDAIGRGGRREADTGSAAADFLGHGVYHLQEEAGAVLDGAAIFVCPLVGTGLQELVDEITVRTVDFDAVETRVDGGAGGPAEIVDDARDFRNLEGAGRRRIREHAVTIRTHDVCLGAGRNCRRRHGGRTIRLQRDVAHPSDMPELGDDPAALGMNGRGDLLPSFGRLRQVKAGDIRVALALLCHGCALGDDQAGGGALFVIDGVQVVGYGLRGAVARQRRHGNAVGKLDIADLDGIKEAGHRNVLLSGKCNARSSERLAEIVDESADCLFAAAVERPLTDTVDLD